MLGNLSNQKIRNIMELDLARVKVTDEQEQELLDLFSKLILVLHQRIHLGQIAHKCTR